MRWLNPAQAETYEGSAIEGDVFGGTLAAVRTVGENQRVGDDDTDDSERALATVRATVEDWPETSERLSHGGPAWFIREKKCFAMFLDDHHGDGRLALWCAALDGVQAEVVATEADTFFVPPYVGHRGWLGVHLGRVDAPELRAILLDAFRTVAPKIVAAQLPG